MSRLFPMLCVLTAVLVGTATVRGDQANTVVVKDCCPQGQFCCVDSCIDDAKSGSIECVSNADCTEFCSTPDPCQQEPHVNGGCGTLPGVQRWSYFPLLNKCEEFLFLNCGSNDNNFESKELCEKTCAQPDCCPPGSHCCGDFCQKDGVLNVVACGDPQCCDPEPCFCPVHAKPVCSLDTKTTYNNACEANCAKDDANLVDGPCVQVYGEK